MKRKIKKGAKPKGNEPLLGKWMIITVSIVGAVMLFYSIRSVYRALTNVSVAKEDNAGTPVSVAPSKNAIAMNAALSQEEMERQHDLDSQRAAPVVQAPDAAPPPVVPTNKPSEEVILQQAKSKVNRRIIERMNQYMKENPNADKYVITKELKKREQQGGQSQ
jgi:hypothetical protein